MQNKTDLFDEKQNTNHIYRISVLEYSLIKFQQDSQSKYRSREELFEQATSKYPIANWFITSPSTDFQGGYSFCPVK